jgi:hypothetical protein
MNGMQTTPSEIGAYVLAHLLGIVSSYLVNPTLFGALIAAGYRASIPIVGFANSVVTMIAVLIMFLMFRKLLRGAPA